MNYPSWNFLDASHNCLFLSFNLDRSSQSWLDIATNDLLAKTKTQCPNEEDVLALVHFEGMKVEDKLVWIKIRENLQGGHGGYT
jgi:hypothetical protein